MGKNIEEVRLANPVTSPAGTDLVYIGQTSGLTYLDGASTVDELASVLGGGDPYQIFWVSQTGSPTGNGSVSSPFDTIESAYLAGVGSGQPFCVALNPGTYDESGTDFELVPFGSILGFDNTNTVVKLGNVTLDSAAWTALGGSTGRIGLYGFNVTAVSWHLTVPTGQVGLSVMRDMIFSLTASEKYTWQNFIEECDFTDCNFLPVQVNFFATLVRTTGCEFSTVTPATYDPDVGAPLGNGRWISNVDRIGSIFAKANSDTLTLEINSNNAPNLSNFFVEGDTIIVRKTAGVADPTISSGTPTIQNIDSAANINAAYPSPTNYTPTSNRVLGHLEGINNALGGGSGFVYENVTTGYVEVADKTIYVIDDTLVGKVYFQTPATMAFGFSFAIYGAGGDPLSNWCLNGQLGQSFINGPDITDVDPNKYPILEPSSPTDRVLFTCTSADQDVSVIWSSSAGLSLYEQTKSDATLNLTISSSAFNINFMALAYSVYSGNLIQIQRSSDSAIAEVQRDLANRASPLSMTDLAVTVAEFALGTEVNILKVYDQSGNVIDFSGNVLWLDSAGDMKNVSDNPAWGSFGAESLGTDYGGLTYSGEDLNVFTVASITSTADSESSIVTLYDPALLDDYTSPLNSICFLQPPPGTTTLETYRAGSLSSVSLSAINTRMVLATSYNNVNNVMSKNGVNGSTVASSGSFGFKNILVGARFEGGGITKQGYYNVAGVAVFGTMAGGDFDTVRTWMTNNL